MKKLLLPLLMSSVLGSGAAVASSPVPLFTVSGGSVFNPMAHDFSATTTMTRGAQLSLVTDSFVTFTFLFREAGLQSTFQVGGNTAISNAAPVNTIFTPSGPLQQGVMNFGFLVPPAASTPNLVTNATNASMTAAGQTSFATRVVSNTSVLLFLDDIGRGGGWDDDDFDDMVVRIDAVAVNPIPEVSTIAMMAWGMGVVAGLRRRRT